MRWYNFWKINLPKCCQRVILGCFEHQKALIHHISISCKNLYKYKVDTHLWISEIHSCEAKSLSPLYKWYMSYKCEEDFTRTTVHRKKLCTVQVLKIYLVQVIGKVSSNFSWSSGPQRSKISSLKKYSLSKTN